MTNLPKDLEAYSRDLVRSRRVSEGEILDNLPIDPKQEARAKTYDFTKEITWTDEYFLTLDRHTVETIARLYREGRGTLVADEYRRTRTWLPNNVLLKPKLGEWAHSIRSIGKYRWLEVNYTTAGGGFSVVTLVYHDHSTQPRHKYRWFQSTLHHSMQAGNWRKTVAKQLRIMHRQALLDRKNSLKRLAHDPRKLLR